MNPKGGTPGSGDVVVTSVDTATLVGESAGEARTVRSEYVYDLGSAQSVSGASRAERIKREIGAEPLVGIEGRPVYRFLKRAFDIVFSAAVLILLSWFFLIIAIVIKVDDPKGPVFFKQERVGKNDKTFSMFKFRSMCVDAEDKLEDLRELNEKTGPVFKIAEDPRITRVGKWLRKLSLDELPQFFNVFLGQIPLRILKTCPELSAKDKGAFALPAKTSTNESKAFSQVVSCFANGLRVRRAASSNFNHVDATEVGFLAKPIFGAVCA